MKFVGQRCRADRGIRQQLGIARARPGDCLINVSVAAWKKAMTWTDIAAGWLLRGSPGMRP
ncbi:MAG: hypothetical protein BGP20_14795 [Thiobacillus sp. 63-78]|nr:MAG: hypothetical protein BGP20_14795 [Thiobacillus sp. 63-78]